MKDNEEVTRKVKSFLEKKATFTGGDELQTTSRFVHLLIDIQKSPDKPERDMLSEFGYSNLKDLERDYSEALKFYGIQNISTYEYLLSRLRRN